MDWGERILRNLNPEQQTAVLHDKGPLLVASVAGSGKTTCLVRRVAYLTTVRGVDPSRILAASFSRDAAQELNKRLVATIGETDARIGTLHSVARQIWLSEKPKYQRWRLDDREWYRAHIKQAVGYRGLNLPRADVSRISLFLTLCKANMLRPGNEETGIFAEQYVAHNRNFMPPGRLVQVYEYTEDLREEALQYTFDDMMMEGAALLLSSEEIRRKWAHNWDYLLIDEGQDLNFCQITACECLARDHRNFMIIGDPAQTVYSFRGAFPQKLLEFESAWDARVVKMHRNYRSGHNIIALANNALDAMSASSRLPMTMSAELGRQGNVHLVETDNADTEGQQVGESIAGILADGGKRSDIIVVYRTNAQSRAIEEYLLEHRIPYRVLGGGSFYQRKEIRGLLNYLRAAEGRATADEAASTLQTPFRYMSTNHLSATREGIRRIQARDPFARIPYNRLAEHIADNERMNRPQQIKMVDWGQTLHAVSSAIHDDFTIPFWWKPETPGDPRFLLSFIADKTGYYQWLEQEEGEESPENNRASNAREFVRSANRFSNVTDLLNYVDETIRAAKDQAKDKNPDKITLSSIHKAKGQEFDTVFLIGANEKILPHYKTNNMEEERRLFYVATTRAKNNLVISHLKIACTSRGELDMLPSRFLFESGLLEYPEEVSPVSA